MEATATRTSFRDRLERGDVLIADGATGTTCQHMGLPLGVAPEEWVLTAPERIVALHRGFAHAGSDIVLTCTFGGTGIRLADGPFAGQASEINRRAAELARAGVGDGVLVAGSLGPTGQLCEPLGLLTHDEAADSYAEQAEALAEGGVDLLVLETMFCPIEASAAIAGVRRASDLPFVLTFSFDRGTRTMMGTTTAEVVELAVDAGAAAVGANCGTSLEAMSAIVGELSAAAPRASPVGQAERRSAAHDRRLRRVRRHARAARRGRAQLRRGGRAHRRRLLRLHAGARARDHRGDQARVSAAAKAASAASPKSTKRTSASSRSSSSAERVEAIATSAASSTGYP